MSAGAIVVAAGTGTRFGGEPKQFRPLKGAPVLAWSCHALARHPAIEEVVAVVPDAVAADPPEWLRRQTDHVVAGGATRRDSVRLGLERLAPTHAVVLVHDGARPFLPVDLIDRLIAVGADVPAIPGLAPTDTVKMVGDGGRVLSTLDRDLLRTVQTPQAFPPDLLRELHARAATEGSRATDDSMLAEAAGVPVLVVRGDPLNLKLTTPADLVFAEWIAQGDALASAGIEPPPTDGG